MAFSISLDNIEIGVDKVPNFGEKTNKNCTAISYAVENIYNKLFLDIATKSIGYLTPINLVNSKVVTITVPSTGYNGEGIVFKQSGTGTELGSIKVSGTGSIDAILGNVTVNSLSLTGTVSGTKITLSSTTDASNIPYLTSSNFVASGGLKVGYTNSSIVTASAQNSNVINIPTTGFDKVSPSKKIYTTTGMDASKTMDINLPAFNSQGLDGYEFSVIVIPNITSNGDKNIILHIVDAGATFLNTGTSSYTIAANYTINKGITVNFKVLANNNVWVTSILA